MAARTRKAADGVDAYIVAFPPGVRAILRRLRSTIRTAAPQAEEIISYRIPAFRLNGILIYFAGFRNHIGIFPPVKADASLEKALAPYRGPKGNLRFPLTEPIPYKLVERIVRLRVKQDRAKATARRNGKR